MIHGTQRLLAVAAAFAVAIALIAAFPPSRAILRGVARAAGFVPTVRPIRTGEAFPTLTLFDLSGNSVRLAPSASGTTVYNVFATWCTPCRDEAPSLKDAARSLSKRGVKFVGIDQGDPTSAVASFIQEFEPGYPVTIDSNRISKQSLGARVIPETIVVRDGIVRSISVGPMTTADFERVVSDSDAS